jgi:hypothetical protein
MLNYGRLKNGVRDLYSDTGTADKQGVLDGVHHPRHGVARQARHRRLQRPREDGEGVRLRLAVAVVRPAPPRTQQSRTRGGPNERGRGGCLGPAAAFLHRVDEQAQELVGILGKQRDFF